MASNALKPALLRNVVKRGYAAQAAVQQQSSFDLPQQETKVTTLPSGAVVASVENNAPVSKLAILFKAGSRYESLSNLGGSHVARVCAGLTTKNFSAFAITRKLQQAGGSLISENGREHTLYSLDIIRNNIDFGLEILGDVSTHPEFKPWELSDIRYRVVEELGALDPSTVTIELLHQAAFRYTGLGNSIFAPPHKVVKLMKPGNGMLADFISSTHTASRMAVVGHGVEHDALVAFAKGLGLSTDAGVSNASTYHGGEQKRETGAAVTVVAVAGAGARLGSSDSAALAVAQHILGVGNCIKRGSNASSVLGRAVAASGGTGSASAINVNYTDGGLFGYFVVAASGSVGQVVKSVHKAVKNIDITDADVSRAKQQAKVAVLMATEASDDAFEDMGMQALLTGKVTNPAAISAAIDGVTAVAVRSALSKVFGGKLSMSAVGSLAGVPYLDEL